MGKIGRCDDDRLAQPGSRQRLRVGKALDMMPDSGTRAVERRCDRVGECRDHGTGRQREIGDMLDGHHSRTDNAVPDGLGTVHSDALRALGVDGYDRS